MGDTMKKENECFQKDYDKLYAKGSWNKDEVSMMKDLKKLIYYNLVIDAMQNGDEYPGSEYMPDMRNSFASRGRMRNSMGQFTSGGMRGYTNGNMSGTYYDDWINNSNPYYDGMGMSGRRYYDSEKEKALHQFHKMMENTDDPERKSALNFAISHLESMK